MSPLPPHPTLPELSFLYTTRHLVLFYICTKYHQIFRRVFVLQSRYKKSNSNTRKGGNSKSKKKTKNKVVIHVCNMSSGPVLHYYQVSSKYSKGCLTYIVDTKSMHNQITKGDNAKSKKGRVVILVRNTLFSFLFLFLPCPSLSSLLSLFSLCL